MIVVPQPRHPNLVSEMLDDLGAVRRCYEKADEVYRHFRVSVMDGYNRIPRIAPLEWIPICNN